MKKKLVMGVIMAAVSWSLAETDLEKGDYESEQDYTVLFAQDELSSCIVSYVDENYRTNADRDHRAFAGFSMGGCTTWNVLMYNLKDFATVIPLSGDCWAVEKTGGNTKPMSDHYFLVLKKSFILVILVH